MKLDIAAARLCQREKTVYHLLQLLRAVSDYFHIIARSLPQFFFFQKLQIADHRGQRRFQIMRNIGNEVYLELLALCRPRHTFLFDLKRPHYPLTVNLLHIGDKRVQIFLCLPCKRPSANYILHQNRNRQKIEKRIVHIKISAVQVDMNRHEQP